MPALTVNNDNDYTLNKDQVSVWVTVDNLSVYITRTDEGVVVDIYPQGQETDECISSATAFFTEGSTTTQQYIDGEG